MDLESLKRVLLALKGEAGKMKGEKLGRRFGKPAPMEEMEAQPEMGLGETAEMPEEAPEAGGVTMGGEDIGGGMETEDESLLELLAKLK